MKIEINKSYRTRSGNKAHVTKFAEGSTHCYQGKMGLEDGSWKENGAYFFTQESDEDLISEWGETNELAEAMSRPQNPHTYVKDIKDKQYVEAGGSEVNHPSHYADGARAECIEIIEDLGLDFHHANAFKYLWRAGKKDPKRTIQDLEKAIWYLSRKVKLMRKEKSICQ